MKVARHVVGVMLDSVEDRLEEGHRAIVLGVGAGIGVVRIKLRAMLLRPDPHELAERGVALAAVVFPGLLDARVHFLVGKVFIEDAFTAELPGHSKSTWNFEAVGSDCSWYFEPSSSLP